MENLKKESRKEIEKQIEILKLKIMEDQNEEIIKKEQLKLNKMLEEYLKKQEIKS